MQTDKNTDNQNPEKKDDNKRTPSEEASRSRQQQSDPQLTELKGFIDEDEDLEPEINDDPEHDHERPD